MNSTPKRGASSSGPSATRGNGAAHPAGDIDDDEFVLGDDDVVPEPRRGIQANAFGALADHGDVGVLVETTMQARLDELAKETAPVKVSGLFPRLVRLLFGPSGKRERLNATDQARAAIREATSLTKEATKFVAAGNKLNGQRIKRANTREYYDLAREKIAADTSAARVQRARSEAEIHELETRPDKEAEISRRVEETTTALKREADALVQRARTEAAAEIKALKQDAATVLRALERDRDDEIVKVRNTGLELMAAMQRLEADRQHAVGRVTEMEQRIAELKEQAIQAAWVAEEQRQRAERLQAEVHRLTAEIERLNAPAHLREETCANARVRAELAKADAEIAKYRAEAKQGQRKEVSSGAGGYATKVRKRWRQAQRRQRVLDEFRREASQALAKTAAQFGEDSEEYRNQANMFDALHQEFEEEELL